MTLLAFPDDDDATLAAALAGLAPLLGETPEQATAATSPNALRDAAVFYAGLGWPVIPLRPGAKLPLFGSAHDPGDPCRGECGNLGHGLWDASTDTDTVAAWWAAEQWANIGLRTGDRFDVADLDVKPGVDGLASFNELCETSGTRPRVLASVQTASGGRHLYVSPTGRGNFAGLRPGFDWRGKGGYVVAPPSRLAPDGARYAWVTSPSADLTNGTAAA
jgi:hypothetical protein